MRLTVISVCLVGFVAGLPSAAAAQDPVDRVRTLYASAAYEDALAAMPPLDDAAKASTDIEPYRALCLLALGREAQAAAAIERLVRDNPAFVPPASDTSPRMQALFAAARGRVLPGLAKQTYAVAKKAYEAKDWTTAHAEFRRTLDLAGAVPDAERAALADLEMLAAEFLELSLAMNAPAPAAAPPAAPAQPAAEQPVTAGPVPIKQELPIWVPPDRVSASTEYVGAIRLDIDAEGRVQGVTVVKPSHPAYDAAVVRAARRWLYKPGTIAGRPVPSQKDIEVRLRAR